MRVAETLLGGLLLLAGGTGLPVGLGLGPADGGPAEGQAVFEAANYTGPAEVQTEEWALQNEGRMELTLSAEQVTVQRYEWEGAHAKAKATDGSIVAEGFVGNGLVDRTTSHYEDATITIDTLEDGVATAWPNASRGPSALAVSLNPAQTPAIVLSPTGGTMWVKWDNSFTQEIEGPVFALGHRGAGFQAAWVEGGLFDRLKATGGMDLNVFGGTVHVDGTRGEDTYRTGRQTTEAGVRVGDAGGSAGLTTERVHALVSVTNATLTTTFERDPSTVVFAHEPTWTVNGSLSFDARSGQLTTGAANVSLSNDTVELLGNTTLSLQAGHEDEGANVDPNLEREHPTPPIHAELDSEANSVTVDGQPLEVEEPAIPEEVTFWGRILGLVLLAFSLAKKLPPFLVGLLARHPLKNDRRKRIFDFVREASMAHPRLIARALSIPVSSAAYHLRILHEAEMLVCVEKEGYTVYFACDEFGIEEKRRLALLASPTREEIATHLAEQGEVTQEALVEVVELAQSTVAEHLDKLESEGLIESERANGVEYRPSRLLETWLSRDRGSVA